MFNGLSVLRMAVNKNMNSFLDERMITDKKVEHGIGYVIPIVWPKKSTGRRLSQMNITNDIQNMKQRHCYCSLNYIKHVI